MKKTWKKFSVQMNDEIKRIYTISEGLIFVCVRCVCIYQMP